mmetsp:Transcript_21560/g.61387  ORF Transcript_21560/g.61387 Transcript_21560/m.61387 type:complete len:275 (+) Transcript_21560:341-1165(+)
MRGDVEHLQVQHAADRAGGAAGCRRGRHAGAAQARRQGGPAVDRVRRPVQPLLPGGPQQDAGTRGVVHQGRPQCHPTQPQQPADTNMGLWGVVLDDASLSAQPAAGGAARRPAHPHSVAQDVARRPTCPVARLRGHLVYVFQRRDASRQGGGPAGGHPADGGDQPAEAAAPPRRPAVGMRRRLEPLQAQRRQQRRSGQGRRRRGHPGGHAHPHQEGRAPLEGLRRPLRPFRRALQPAACLGRQRRVRVGGCAAVLPARLGAADMGLRGAVAAVH